MALKCPKAAKLDCVIFLCFPFAVNVLKNINISENDQPNTRKNIISPCRKMHTLAEKLTKDMSTALSFSLN
jgi:hypothetical protein